jgi:site-specific DNA-adenine methylase
MPPHKNYIELFLGSGAVIRNKRPAAVNIGVDRDRSLIDIFNYPREMTFYDQGCFEFLANNYIQYRKDTYIYADPPYLFDTRFSDRPMYKYEFTDEDHERLLKELVKLDCMVSISGYESKLYNERLKGWRKVFYYQVDRAGRRRKECLYCNYPKPEQLHDYGHLGQDFTERQRIKRKINRHVNRLLSLPTLERNAILNAIQGLRNT